MLDAKVVRTPHRHPEIRVSKTRRGPNANKVLSLRGSLMIWFDPEMTRAAKTPGKRRRGKYHGNSVIQACLTKTALSVGLLHRAAKDPLRLLIERSRIKAADIDAWHTHAQAQNAANGARFASEMMKRRPKRALSCSRATLWEKSLGA